jgi:hypothetical protein
MGVGGTITHHANQNGSILAYLDGIVSSPRLEASSYFFLVFFFLP